jgi:galactokinase
MQQRMELLAAKKANDLKAQGVALGAILDLITQGHSDYRAWGELQSVLEQRRRLVESERKRQVEMQQMITSQQAMGLISAILESVKRNVTDRAALSAIQTDFIRLTTRDDSTIVDVG